MPDFSVKQRQKLAAKGQAMPQGGFPIRNRADLKRAIQAIGRASNPDAAKAWIKKRAKELNAMDMIPQSWSAAHSSLGGDMLKEKPSLDELTELQHHGIKGMKWGVRSRPVGGSLRPGRATGEIRVARRNVKAAAKASRKEKIKFVKGQSSMAKVHEMKLAFLMHPDRATAHRLTRGETAALAVLGAPGLIGASQINSRLITSRQAQGYKKPGSNRAIVRVIGA